MEQYKICVVLFVLISLNKTAMLVAPAGPNFQHALQLIKPPIDYNRFCVQKDSGGDKIACRIKDEPTVGLLVCQTALVGHEKAKCADVINMELQYLVNLRDAGIRAVVFHQKPITGLNCGEKPAEVCSGFLEEWVGADRGRFKHISDAIAQNTVPALIQQVRGFSTPAGLTTTVADLMKIRNYMHMDATATKFRQICDFQGFFLINGGLLVADVPDIMVNIGLTDRCEAAEPTTQEVLTALNDMITAFQ